MSLGDGRKQEYRKPHDQHANSTQKGHYQMETVDFLASYQQH